MPFFRLCIAACMMHGCCYIAKAKQKNQERKGKVILFFFSMQRMQSVNYQATSFARLKFEVASKNFSEWCSAADVIRATANEKIGEQSKLGEIKLQLLSSPHLRRQNLRRLGVSHPRPLLLLPPPPPPPLCW